MQHRWDGHEEEHADGEVNDEHLQQERGITVLDNDLQIAHAHAHCVKGPRVETLLHLLPRAGKTSSISNVTVCATHPQPPSTRV